MEDRTGEIVARESEIVETKPRCAEATVGVVAGAAKAAVSVRAVAPAPAFALAKKILIITMFLKGDTLMSKEYNTSSIPLNCKEEGNRRKCTIAMRFLKISLKIVICLLILSLGFILSELSYTARHQKIDDQIDDPIEGFHQLVYLYDTKKKLEDYYKMRVWVSIDELKLHPESSEARAMIDYLGKMGLHLESPEARAIVDFVRNERPLARVGPFVVFASSDNGEFSVHEQSSGLPLITLRSNGQSKSLTLYSSVEPGWNLPRFDAHFTYSEDGVYESGRFFVGRSGENPARTYEDTKGIGVFDTMSFFENDAHVTYRLNGLTWEREVSVPNPWQSGLPPPMGMPLPVPNVNTQ